MEYLKPITIINVSSKGVLFEMRKRSGAGAISISQNSASSRTDIYIYDKNLYIFHLR